ncbi:MAG: cob(I)yrinic acid a,c-diamide adenosyltransferase [Planctomycetes bacterium]|nr:cob(I)yrinic acid a,c-diamide adenosyltransferase [Planctomycetota bacterium]
MVFLNRIYTKTGDMGETSLGDGSRVPKTDLRIKACGNVDELNAAIGVASIDSTDLRITGFLRQIQNDLFDLGADLCVPESDNDSQQKRLRMRSDQTEQLESWIDELNESLAPLTSFVLPGGSPFAASLHLARSICRRAEISVLELSERELVGSPVRVYLNRLSDLLFVLARTANDCGRTDVLWIPGGNQSQASKNQQPKEIAKS